MFTMDIYEYYKDSKILNLKSFLGAKHQIVIIDNNVSFFLKTQKEEKNVFSK